MFLVWNFVILNNVATASVLSSILATRWMMFVSIYSHTYTQYIYARFFIFFFSTLKDQQTPMHVVTVWFVDKRVDNYFDYWYCLIYDRCTMFWTPYLINLERVPRHLFFTTWLSLRLSLLRMRRVSLLKLLIFAFHYEEILISLIVCGC